MGHAHTYNPNTWETEQNYELSVSLDYIARPCPENKTAKKRQKWYTNPTRFLKLCPDIIMHIQLINMH
jgi:hypothetical protein